MKDKESGKSQTIREEANFLLGFSAQKSRAIIKLLGGAFGVRRKHVPPLTVEDRLQFDKQLRLLVGGVVLSAVAIWYAQHSMGIKLERLAFTSGKEIPNLELFLEQTRINRQLILGVAAACTALLAWTIRMVVARGLHPVFCLLSVMVGVTAITSGHWIPDIYRDHVLGIYRQGTDSFQEALDQLRETGHSDFDRVYDFFDHLRPMVAGTFIENNVLGRMAGCRYYLGDDRGCLALARDTLLADPEKELEKGIRTTVRWSIERFSENASVEEFCDLFEELSLGEVAISPFQFRLSGRSRLREVRQSGFGSLKPGTSHDVNVILERFPDDPWGSYAAWYAGNEEFFDEEDGSDNYCISYRLRRAHRLYRQAEYQRAAEAVERYLEDRSHDFDLGDARNLLMESLARFATLQEFCQRMLPYLTTAENSAIHFEHGVQGLFERQFIAVFAYTDSFEEQENLLNAWGPSLPEQLRATLAIVAGERRLLERIASSSSAVVLASISPTALGARSRNTLPPYVAPLAADGPLNLSEFGIWLDRRMVDRQHLFDRELLPALSQLGVERSYSFTEAAGEAARTLVERSRAGGLSNWTIEQLGILAPHMANLPWMRDAAVEAVEFALGSDGVPPVRVAEALGGMRGLVEEATFRLGVNRVVESSLANDDGQSRMAQVELLQLSTAARSITGTMKILDAIASCADNSLEFEGAEVVLRDWNWMPLERKLEVAEALVVASISPPMATAPQKMDEFVELVARLNPSHS